MRLLTALAVALVFVASAAAGTTVKVPAPAVGKVRIEKLTIKAASQPTLSVSNLSALGPGFGGVGVLQKGKAGTWVLYVVMFMGNASTSPASTVTVVVSGGAPTGHPTDVTKSCPALKGLDAGLETILARYVDKFDKGDSGAREELHNDLDYQLQADGCG